jgi:hypothetical protein
MRKNEGIIFSGGTQTVGQVVAGRNAHSYMRVGGTETGDSVRKEELSRKLDELIRLLQEHQNTLPEGMYLVGDARRIEAEITKPAPNKGKLSSLLQVIEAGTKDLASVASLVSSIKALATGLFGIA